MFRKNNNLDVCNEATNMLVYLPLTREGVDPIYRITENHHRSAILGDYWIIPLTACLDKASWPSRPLPSSFCFSLKSKRATTHSPSLRKIYHQAWVQTKLQALGLDLTTERYQATYPDHSLLRYTLPPKLWPPTARAVSIDVSTNP